VGCSIEASEYVKHKGSQISKLHSDQHSTLDRVIKWPIVTVDQQIVSIQMLHMNTALINLTNMAQLICRVLTCINQRGNANKVPNKENTGMDQRYITDRVCNKELC
jgi:hypothetical protein